jgi:hypothetical protein
VSISSRIPFRLNTHRLAGLPRALGIEIGDHETRLVEVERAGLITRAPLVPIKLLWSYDLRLEWESKPEEIATKLTNLFDAMRSGTCRAAVSLRPEAIRLVRTEIPEKISNIPEWVEDNCDKLLQLPIPINELAFTFRALPTSEHDGNCLEIAFVRRREIEKCLEVCRLASLEVVFMGLLAGSIAGPSDNDKDPEYAVPQRLATLALLPSEESFDFLPVEAHNDAEKNLYGRLTKRVGGSAAVVLLMVLLAEFLGSTYLDTREKILDESSASNKATVNELAALEKNVKILDERLAAVRFGGERTELARSLHDVASVPGRAVKFRRLALYEKNVSDKSFMVTGEAPSHEELARFLAALDTSSFCQHVALLKSGTSAESASGGHTVSRGSILFEIEGHLR